MFEILENICKTFVHQNLEDIFSIFSLSFSLLGTLNFCLTLGTTIALYMRPAPNKKMIKITKIMSLVALVSFFLLLIPSIYVLYYIYSRGKQIPVWQGQVRMLLLQWF